MKLIFFLIFSVFLPQHTIANELPQSVKRSNNTLTLQLENGLNVERVDSPTPFEGYFEAEKKPNRIYTFFADTPAYYILDIRYWEGIDYEFINKNNGASFITPGAPFFSDNHNYFFLVTPDAYTNEEFQFQIWRIEPEKIYKVWSMGTLFFRSEIAGEWESDNLIKLYKINTRKNEEKEFIATIRLINDIWHLKFQYSFTLKREIPKQLFNH